MNNITLGSVAKDLELWRRNKPKYNSIIPSNIKNSIKLLSKHYNYKQLSKALRIYGASLTNIIKNSKPKQNKIKFIELQSNIKPILTIPCVLKRTDGTSMIIEASEQQLANIINSFVCCN